MKKVRPATKSWTTEVFCNGNLKYALVFQGDGNWQGSEALHLK